MAKPAYCLTEFSPALAEQITGVSTTLQRDWRRRKFLSRNEAAHARFNLISLSHLMVLKGASQRGIGPQLMIDILDRAAAGIAFAALLHNHAYEGSLRPATKKRALSVMRSAGILVPSDARFLVLWADGTESWTDNIQEQFEEIRESEAEEKFGGPIVIFDEWHLGDLLVRRAGRPFVSSPISHG